MAGVPIWLKIGGALVLAALVWKVGVTALRSVSVGGGQVHTRQPEEAEDVFSNDPLVVRGDVQHSKREKRYYALGRADEGRYLFVAFTIRGSGTVVTGTLTGGELVAGDEAEILPSGHRARIRSLQTHHRGIDRAAPVSRVAVNLVGTTKDELDRVYDYFIAAADRKKGLMDEEIVAIVKSEVGRLNQSAGRAQLQDAGQHERDRRQRTVSAGGHGRQRCHDSFLRSRDSF